MKFIKDGWHWLEIDEYGNIIGSLTNSEHAAILKQARLEYAQNWFHAHTDWNTLMAYPDYLHELIHAVQHHSNTVLAAFGVNLLPSPLLIHTTNTIHKRTNVNRKRKENQKQNNP